VSSKKPLENCWYWTSTAQHRNLLGSVRSLWNIVRLLIASRIRRRLAPLCRRANVALTIVAYAVASVGYPAPNPASAKWRGEPFPCQDRPCGCLDAIQCWTSCRCTTAAERIVWARRNGVAIPAYARLTATDYLNADSLEQSGEQEDGQTGCCCCKADATRGVDADAAPLGHSAWRLIPSLAARQCRAQGDVWMTLAVVAPPGRPATVVFTESSIGWLDLTGETAPSRSIEPPMRPPRV
jgi:hypothetical protein